MLAYCLWHRPKIKTALGQCRMFAGILCDQSTRNQYIIAYIFQIVETQKIRKLLFYI